MQNELDEEASNLPFEDLGVDSFDEDENTLTLDEFFEITFGSDPLDFDSTQFVTEELTVEMVNKCVERALQISSHGILRDLFPYLIDILSRT
ncbi:13027_t:CDS:2, partial [Ambispora gerdemannii]